MDIDIVQSLSTDELKELIPTLGGRKKFQVAMSTFVTTQDTIVIPLTQPLNCDTVFILYIYIQIFLMLYFCIFLTVAIAEN